MPDDDNLAVLMVALLENEQRRSDQAVQRKLNTMAALPGSAWVDSANMCSW